MHRMNSITKKCVTGWPLLWGRVRLRGRRSWILIFRQPRDL